MELDNKIIKVDKQELVNTSTGEIIEVDQITKVAYGQKQFVKMYLFDLLNALGIIDSKQLDVFTYIVANTDTRTNYFIGTYKKIAQSAHVSEPTISKIMKKLQELNMIKKVQNGVWFISPELMIKGGEQKRQILLTYYNQLDNPKDKTILGSVKATRVTRNSINEITDDIGNDTIEPEISKLTNGEDHEN